MYKFTTTSTLAFVLLATPIILGAVDAATAPAPCGCLALTALERACSSGLLENRGQWDEGIAFASLDLGYRAVVTPSGFRVWPPNAAQGEASISFGFEIEHGSTEMLAPTGEGGKDGRYSFVLGNDPDHWAAEVRNFESVRFSASDGSLDVILAMDDRGLRFDWIVQDREALARFGMRLTGASEISIDECGSLHLRLGNDVLRINEPNVFATGDHGAREVRSGRPILIDGNLLRYVVDASDRGGQVLTVDPGLEWATALGGSIATGAGPFNKCATEHEVSLHVADNGDVIAVGHACTVDFPTTPGAYQTIAGGKTTDLTGSSDVVVTRLAADGGSLRWSTYVGGSSVDESMNSVLLGSDRVVVVGRTSDSLPTFPTTSGAAEPVDVSKNGTVGFAFCLEEDGSNLVYSTFIGAKEYCEASDVTITNSGDIWIAGMCIDSPFVATNNAFQSSNPCLATEFPNSGFVLQLSADAKSYPYLSYVGGTDQSYTSSIAAIDESRFAISGSTSGSFPVTTGAFDVVSTWVDSYVAILNAATGTLEAATYVGGDLQHEAARDIAVGAGDSIFAIGVTASVDFPTTPDSISPTIFGLSSSFLVRLPIALDKVIYSTYITSGSTTEARKVVADETNVATVFGNINGFSLPTTVGSYKPQNDGPAPKVDGFVWRVAPDGRRLYYGSYFGSPMNEGDTGDISPVGNVDKIGSVVLGGRTFSELLPFTNGAFDTTLAGLGDAFVARLDMSPAGATKLGLPTPETGSEPYVEALEMPRAGDGSFEFRCASGPKNKPGFLLVSTGSAASTSPPTTIGCLDVWPSIAAGLAIVAVQSDGDGACYLSVPLRATQIGKTAIVQFVFEDTSSPCGLSASNALKIVVQP